MINKCFIYIALFLCIGSISADNTNIEIQLSKNSKAEWRLSYHLPQKVKQLHFIRNPNDARTKRWFSETSGMEIVFINGQEIIRHKDGKSFSQVQFKLTPTYTHLPNDYAPFMNFSDGGIAVYSGRYFVCLETCEQAINSWSFTLNAQDNDTIISKGKLTIGSASWNDNNSGHNVYIGPQKPIESSHFHGIIDPVLPKIIVEKLNHNLPQLMDFFATKLGTIEQKPLVFASFEQRTDGSQGNQGGTLPNQVFMFWYGGDIKQRVKADYFLDSLLWFYAHEAAHFFQQGKFDNQHAWIHEGSAELMAFLAINKIMPASQTYANLKFETSNRKCKKTRKEISLATATENGQFQMHYECGLIMLKALHEDLIINDTKSDGIYELWRLYLSAIEEGNPASIDTFLNQIKKLLGNERASQIEDYVKGLE